MLGKQDSQLPLFIAGFDLGGRIRRDHPLRKLKELVDFSFVRKEVAHLYGYNGNVSVDPEVIMKMMFLLFFYDIKSERRLMLTIPERLDFLWFLGYGLDEKVPDHSVLSKARRRWGARTFRSFFVETIAQCVKAGLVDGSKIHVDGSLVDADASNDSVRKASPELVAALRDAYERTAGKLDEAAQEVGEEPQVEEKPRPPSAYDPVNKKLVSTTDPDAAVVRRGRGEPRLRYKNHRAIDDAHGVVTATKTTPGDAKENGELMGLVDQHERNTRRRVDTAVADSQYGTVENFRACKQRSIRSHMADLSAKSAGKGRRAGIFGESEFAYDPATDTYRCPGGQTLRRRRHKKKRRAFEYTAGPKVCNACPLRPQCTRSSEGRNVKRHEDHELIEAARAQSHSAAAKRDRRRRKHLAEWSFADAANNHRFKRSRWRGLWRQEIQDFLIAAIQNIRILLRHGLGSTKGALPGSQELTASVFCLFFAALFGRQARLAPTATLSRSSW